MTTDKTGVNQVFRNCCYASTEPWLTDSVEYMFQRFIDDEKIFHKHFVNLNVYYDMILIA